MRLCKYLLDIIGLEQVGFMPGREARDNKEGLLLSTDAEKTFDSVAWDFMLSVCTHIGLKTNMLTWISALYQNP